MITSRMQQQSTLSTLPVASAPSVWTRWLPLWHGFFYVTLVLVTIVTLVGDSYSWWQYLAIFGLSLQLGIWYAVCVKVDPLYWTQHSLITMGYFAIGWMLWLGLIILFPIYLFLLTGLYPQAFTFPRTPWKIIAGIILTALCLWRQTLAEGGWGEITFISLGAGVAGMIMALFIAAIVEQSIERHALIQELEATRHELAIVERQAGIMDERQRLAREIHDTLAQGFTSIVMHLEAAEGSLTYDMEVVRRHFDQARRTARENLAEARRLMWALQPEALDRASLPEVLASLAKHWSEESAVAASATVTGTSHALRPEIDVTLLRAAQEALANTRKYAQASQVSITLSYMDDLVVLDIQDNGRGFDPAHTLNSPLEQTSGGFGLKALHERVEQLGGTLSIESTPGEGTTLAVALPLLSDEAPPACPQAEAMEEVYP